MKFCIFPPTGNLLKMRKIAARYSFQHACHVTRKNDENCRRSAPKYAHICRKKSRICKMLKFIIF